MRTKICSWRPLGADARCQEEAAFSIRYFGHNGRQRQYSCTEHLSHWTGYLSGRTDVAKIVVHRVDEEEDIDEQNPNTTLVGDNLPWNG